MVFAASLFLSCNNKLNLLAPYKESVSVYGLLDKDDPIHYIRVERIYLGEGDALVMAQNQDSVYFNNGDLTVSLQRFKNGARVSVDNNSTALNEIVLTDTLITLQGDGQFNPNARVYKTIHPIYTDCSYKLVIHNNRTGKEYTAQTNMIDFQYKTALNYTEDHSNKLLYNFNPASPAIINIAPGAKGVVTAKYYAPKNAMLCGLKMRMFYTENGAPLPHKYFDVNLGDYYNSSANGGEVVDFSYTGATVYSQLATNLSSDNSFVSRTLDSVEYLVNTGGYDLSLYNQVNQSVSLAQTKPNYTNIQGGYGVFSCRNTFKLGKQVLGPAKDSLSSNPTVCKLRFTNQAGNTTVCH